MRQFFRKRRNNYIEDSVIGIFVVWMLDRKQDCIVLFVSWWSIPIIMPSMQDKQHTFILLFSCLPIWTTTYFLIHWQNVLVCWLQNHPKKTFKNLNSLLKKEVNSRFNIIMFLPSYTERILRRLKCIKKVNIQNVVEETRWEMCRSCCYWNSFKYWCVARFPLDFTSSEEIFSVSIDDKW